MSLVCSPTVRRIGDKGVDTTYVTERLTPVAQMKVGLWHLSIARCHADVFPDFDIPGMSFGVFRFAVAYR
jgi:hypothetical protein